MGIPRDSGSGMVGRPYLTSADQGQGPRGGRVATVETLFTAYIDNLENPDYAISQDPNADEVIRQQPDVAATLNLRELTVASMPWTVEPAKVQDDKKAAFAEEVANYVRDVLDELPNIQELYRNMQKAVSRGGAGIEFIWELDENGVERPVQYYDVHVSRFIFDRVGKMALLTRNQPTWGAYVATPGATAQPTIGGAKAWFPIVPGKFVYHAFGREGGSWYRPATEGFNYYGKGLNGQLYNLVLFDQFVTRFRIRYLERFGYPLSMLYYPDGDDNASQQLLQIAQQVRKESIASIPRRAGEAVDGLYKLEYFQPNMSGQDYFEKFSEFMRMKIEKIILGGANLTQLGPSGSYGASVDQRDSGSDIVFRYDAKLISSTLNQQLIPHIVWAKWPDCPKNLLPKHNMSPKQATDKSAELGALQLAAGMVPISRQDIYRAAGVEAPKADAKPESIVFLGTAPDMVGGLDSYPSAFVQPGGKTEKAEDGEPRKPIGKDGKPASGAALDEDAGEDAK
jgi:phage gp29-like protein